MGNEVAVVALVAPAVVAVVVPLVVELMVGSTVAHAGRDAPVVLDAIVAVVVAAGTTRAAE